MKTTALLNYARLIAQKGVNVQKGQEVNISADLDQPEFVKLLVEECYRAGASKVVVDWSYQPLTRLHVSYRSQSTLNSLEDYELARWQHKLDKLPAMIHLVSSDPDGLAGIDQKKYSESIRSRNTLIKPIRDKMEGSYQWCIAAVPGRAWASKVFPRLSPALAVERLWEEILRASRAFEGDAVENWGKHNSMCAERCAYLNSLHLDSLHYTASNGTDFTVGLIENSLFLGGDEGVKGSEVRFNPNIPTEEIFVSPMRGRAEGIVYSSKPLSYNGEIIDGFSVRFEGGRATELHAEKNEELLRKIVSYDEGASYLGECALVPYDSPISRSGILFQNTLFDENASCHLALGRGFANTLADYEELTLEQCRERGINDSIIHVDFMIGTEDLCITGRDKKGNEYEIFKNGNWAKGNF